MQVGAKETNVANELGMSCRHARDLYRECHKSTSDMRPGKRRNLTDKERERASRELQAGTRLEDVAFDLEQSARNMYDIYKKARTTESTAELASCYTSACSALKELDTGKEDLLLLQRLEPVDLWIKETQQKLTALERKYPEEFHWQNLQETVDSFSRQVQMMGIVEMQRAHRLLEEIKNLTERMQKIETSLRRFGSKEEEPGACCVKLRLKCPTRVEDEDRSPVKRRRTSLSASEEDTSSSDFAPVDSPQQP